MVVEPGGFRTDFADRSLHLSAETIDAYAATAGLRRSENITPHGRQPGDPVRAARAIILALEADTLPFRLVLGRSALQRIRAAMDSQRREIRCMGGLGERSRLSRDIAERPIALNRTRWRPDGHQEPGSRRIVMADPPKRQLGHTGLQFTMLGYGAMELRNIPRSTTASARSGSLIQRTRRIFTTMSQSRKRVCCRLNFTPRQATPRRGWFRTSRRVIAPPS